MPRAMHLEEVLLEIAEQLGLRLVLAPHRRHFLLQVADDVCVRLAQAHTLHELVDLPDRRVLRHVLQVVEKVGHLLLQQLAGPLATLQWLIPERADVHAHALRCLDHFAKRPHQSAVDAHELLRIHLVGLVEHDADLVVVALEGLNGVAELVGDVELVRVEEQQDHVAPRREPLDDRRKLIRATNALLLAGEDARSVDEGDVVEQRHVELRALKLGEEAIPEHLEPAERHVRRHGQRVARCLLVVRAMHHGDESVCRRLGANVLAREVAAEQVADERGLTN
mmetsp:Transcript_18257/g.46749  ORF Transcript_18257/g.46749 Transcript_18257/m.46749 type:complete len:281 (-) Transcript_18257:243-1085(-)